MQESEIDLPTPDGTMNTWMFLPDGAGPSPAVLLFMDAPGVRDELMEMARAICAAGYAVLLPNLYYRTDRSVDFSPARFETEGEPLRQAMFAKVRSLTFEKIVRDTAVMLDCLRQRPEVAGPQVAAVGYCMSGRWVVAAALAFPGDFAAIASFYGTGLVTANDDSPHRRIHDARCELYFAFAENDSFVPSSDVAALRETLSHTNVAHTIETYPGTQHGFAFRRGHYNAAAADRHWKAIFALLARRLPTTAGPGR